MRPCWRRKKNPTKQRSWPVWAVELGTGSEIYWAEICYHLKKRKKSSKVAVLFHWQWCNADDTPGREGPVRSVTAQHVHGVTWECPTSQQIQPSASTSSRASFSSQYLYRTAGSMFLEVTHRDCTCTISKTPPFAPPIFCALGGFRFFFLNLFYCSAVKAFTDFSFTCQLL